MHAKLNGFLPRKDYALASFLRPISFVLGVAQGRMLVHASPFVLANLSEHRLHSRRQLHSRYYFTLEKEAAQEDLSVIVYEDGYKSCISSRS